MVSRRLKRLAASQGKKVVARIVKVAYMGAEGSKHNTIPIYRFDLGVDDEGETVREHRNEIEKFGRIEIPTRHEGQRGV